MISSKIFRRIWDYKFVATPYFIVIYACLHILSGNILDIPIKQSLPTLFISSIFVTFIILISFFFSRNLHRSVFLTALIIFFSLSYGHIFHYTQNIRLSGFALANHYILLPFFIILVSTMVISFNKLSGEKSVFFSNILLLISTTAVMLPFLIYTIPTVYFRLDPFQFWESDNGQMIQLSLDMRSYKNSQTDVYYIILDGYGRRDILLDYYQFDNTDFIEYLENKGFYIAEESRSNYIQTSLSIASSLNLSYIEPNSIFNENTIQRWALKNLINESNIRSFFERQGYQFITIDSGYLYTNIENADIHLSPFISINDFERIFLTSSVFVIADDLNWNRIPFYTYNTHRRRLQYAFNQLTRIKDFPGKNFVFVHLVIPHPPFVVDEYGNPKTPWRAFSMGDVEFVGTQEEYINGFIDQIKYTNQQITKFVDSVLNQSDSDAIIVLQGDHGPRLQTNWDSIDDTCIREAVSILNAYYLPNQNSFGLYLSITPVNTFRIILNDYFGTQLEMQPDSTYFSNYLRPFNFTDVTEVITDGCQ